MWGTVLKRDLLGETREEDKFRSREQLSEYIKSEIKRQGTNVVIKNLDVSLIDDLSALFNGCENIITLDLSGWKTSGVKDMSDMFDYCENLKSLDVSDWDTSKVKDMSVMFSYCRLKSLDLSGWKTSNVNYMYDMFSYCVNLKTLDLSGWDTSNVMSMDMNRMFADCPAPYVVIDNKIVKK